MSKGLRVEIEALRRLGKVRQPSEKARQRMLESIFLNGITEFESFLEDVFLAAVSGRIRPGSTKPVVGLRNPDIARSLILRPRETYLDWMPIERCLERADRFLVDGQPFSRFATRPAIKQRLKAASAVRNAVAHKGMGAQTRFRQMTSGKYRSPGEYLAAKLGAGTVCEGFLDDFVRYGRSLCVSDSEALALLGPEGPYQAGTVVEPGNYECLQCGHSCFLAERGQLACVICDPPCADCGHPTGKSASFNRV
jgi:hypothetical protein